MIVQILAALFPIQFPADAPGKAVENGLSAWSPVTHVGVPDGVSCSFFGPGPDLVPISIWGVNLWMEYIRDILSLSLCLNLSNLSISVTAFQINKWAFKKKMHDKVTLLGF